MLGYRARYQKNDAMLKLSFWAKKHPVQSWAIIAFGRAILGALALSWGFVLAAEGHYFAKGVFGASALLYLIGYGAYPDKKEGRHRLDNFTRRKCCDALLVASSFLAWGGVGNFLPAWSLSPTNRALPTEPAQIPVLQSAMSNPFEAWPMEKQSAKPHVLKAKSGTFFQKIKAWKQTKLKNAKASIRKNIALIRHAAKELEAGKIALLVLASLAIFAVLGYLTAAISCSLSCNGQEGAATTVLVFGCVAIAGIIALVWTSAVKNDRRKKQAEELKGISPALLPVHSEQTVQVAQSEFRVCISGESPNDKGVVSVFMGEQVLLYKATLGNVPYCFNVALNPGNPNKLIINTISTEEMGSNKLRIFVEHSSEKNFFPVEIEAEKTTVLHFQRKE